MCEIQAEHTGTAACPICFFVRVQAAALFLATVCTTAKNVYWVFALPKKPTLSPLLCGVKTTDAECLNLRSNAKCPERSITLERHSRAVHHPFISVTLPPPFVHASSWPRMSCPRCAYLRYCIWTTSCLDGGRGRSFTNTLTGLIGISTLCSCNTNKKVEISNCATSRK